METPHAAFDNDKYIALQSAAIRERAERFGNKLYLEIGGKLLKDLHAARVLPGFEPDVKLRMLQTLGDQIEFIVCAYAGDIEHQRYRADFGTTYDAEVLRLVEDVRARGLAVRSVVLTRFDPSMTAAAAFADRLRREGLAVYLHSAIPGYPADVDRILSDDGFGRNPMVETTAPIVGVIAPGPSSGKLATALSQVWHENRRGVGAGYAKYETFPVWNLPLSHAVNIAYEAATADIEDFNQIDPFHLEAYGETTVNYNRDVAAFPILRALLERLLPADQVYRSPTDMGVNKVGFAIADDERVQEASRQEIVRRFHDKWIIAGYDLINEPVSSPVQHEYIPLLEQYYEECIARIRKIDKEHIIFLEGAKYARDARIFKHQYDPECHNWAISIHLYGASPEIKDLYPWLLKREELQVPLWLG